VKKTFFINIFYTVLFCLFFLSSFNLSHGALNDDFNNTASRIMTELKIPDNSTSVKTKEQIRNDLLSVQNLIESMKEMGVTDSRIESGKQHLIGRITESAKISYYEIENPGWFNPVTKKDKDDFMLSRDILAANLGEEYQLAAQSVFSTTPSSAAAIDEARRYSESIQKYIDDKRKITTTSSIGSWDGTYKLLAPLGNLIGGNRGVVDINKTDGSGIADYLEALFRAGIAIATGLALIMIVYGGFLYTSTDAIYGKDEGKKIIGQALLGLLLALSAVLLLQQLNPALLRNDVVLNQDIVLPTLKIPTYKVLENKPISQNIIDSTNTLVDQTIYNLPVSGKIPGTKIRLTNFPNMEWQAYARQQVINSGLQNLQPADLNKFFPNGASVDSWVSFMAGVVERESSFKPGTTFQEPPPLNYASVGLMQLSEQDSFAKAQNCNNECLKNPLKNLQIGISLMAHLIRRDGCISCKNSSGNWRGASAYWSVLRP
jgi:hypothetical protein